MNLVFDMTGSKKERDTHTLRYISLAIGAFIALATLIIALITLKYDDSIIKILLIIQLFVLIMGFLGNSVNRKIKGYLKKRKLDDLAKIHFDKLRKLVLRFEEFTENRMDNIQPVMHGLQGKTEFKQINIAELTNISDWYSSYKRHLNQFDGTKDNLETLANEFKSILDMYDRLYIKAPIEKIRDIGYDKVPKRDKILYNIAREKYVAFITNYKNFAKDANADFSEIEKSHLLGDDGIFKAKFDIPEEL
ncbi:MAG: hypothetical protein GQ533_04155 [Methanosarcinaceae archaeon]|nr:hypothetical protein [Methanosarcinaceae archaeon]